VAEKKFPVGPLPRATLGKDIAECLMSFAESFRPSVKPGFPVVYHYMSTFNCNPKQLNYLAYYHHLVLLNYSRRNEQMKFQKFYYVPTPGKAEI
jgi:hypothetical protein